MKTIEDIIINRNSIKVILADNKGTIYSRVYLFGKSTLLGLKHTRNQLKNNRWSEPRKLDRNTVENEAFFAVNDQESVWYEVR